MIPGDVLTALTDALHHAGSVGVLGEPAETAVDVTVVVPDAVYGDICAVLHAAGFAAVDLTWARFRAGETAAVRVVPVRRLALPAAAVDELFGRAGEDGATGGESLRAAASEHALLFAGQRLLEGGGTDVLRAALERQRETAPEAWLESLRLATAWGLPRAMAHLERLGWGQSITETDRRDALRDLRRAGRLDALRHPVVGVVGLSGLDGSGKSTQAQALRDSLAASGVSAVVEWTRLAAQPALDRIAAPVKALLRRGRSAPTHLESPTPATAHPTSGAATAGVRRPAGGRRGPVGAIWPVVVAGVDAAAKRSSTALHVRQDRVVIRDRYTLDSAVQLEDAYGGSAAGGLLLRRLAPPPVAAFLLDLPGAVTHQRKPEQFTPEMLEAQAGRYRQEARRLGVTVLDGTRSAEELAEQIATEVWARLGRAAGGAAPWAHGG
jgi:thymidylate kinase